MIKNFKKPINAFMYLTNDTTAIGSPLMGANIIDVIHKTLQCKIKGSIKELDKVYKIEITICKISSMGAIC